MKVEVKIKKEVEVKTLLVEAQPRYWEDATVDHVEDVDGNLIPCRNGELWCPKINLDSGVIKNWKQGVVAEIHYKVCDAGSYYLLDEEGNKVLSIENDYVPSILCPDRDGYGDYIIMSVRENGQINNWNGTDIGDFQIDED